jgi:hypothetical protein
VEFGTAAAVDILGSVEALSAVDILGLVEAAQALDILALAAAVALAREAKEGLQPLARLAE